MTPLAAAQSHEPVRQDAALEESVERILDKSRQLGAHAGIDVGDAASSADGFGARDGAGAVRRPPGPPADGVQGGLQTG